MRFTAIIAAGMFGLSGGPANAQPQPVPQPRPLPGAGGAPQPQMVRRPMPAPPVRIEGSCATVPFRLSRASPVVEVTINGRGPYRFMIETGAQGHGRITAALAQELGLPQTGEVRTPAPGGSVAMRPVWRVNSLRVGRMTLGDLQLVAAPNIPGAPADIDGMLGIDLFRELTLAVDFGNNLASIRRAPLDGGISADFSSGFAVVPVEIGGRTFQVTLDTGNSAGALFLPEADARGLPLAGEPVERGRARTSFGELAIMEAPLSVPVTVGGVPLPVRTVGWPPARGAPNLGPRGLTGMVLALDRRSSRASIRPSGAPPSCPAG